MSVPSISGKRNSYDYREAIQHKRPAVLIAGVVLMTIPCCSQNLKNCLQKFKCKNSGPPHTSRFGTTQSDFKHLSEQGSFSLNSDGKTAAENWLSGKDMISTKPV
ncbi:hypothetical protein AVEN_119055-1 [Araneus ventricosus]|uniref:Uncharacterized protein n=1 Tax=Araneus ventricosus TaxID=182803 RepID=A0A4Y2PMF5_ARAVE|nr:hypothetical protein AVEN_119055-1 [Araneus ventricosus]